jgi:endonuclease/exonuclease/phosphatase (EEP) superfamily protein YafD
LRSRPFGRPYRRFLSLAALPFLCTACGDPPAPAGPLIVIDGELADWDTVPTLLVDPSENGPGAVDLGEVRIGSDDSAVYFALDFGRTVNAQAMQGSVRLELDTDGDAATGGVESGMAGADRTIVFSSHRLFGGPVGSGVETTSPGVYGIGFDYAPTWASRYFEVRIDRTAFTADTLRGRLSYMTPDGATADETDVFTAALRPPVGRSARQADAAAVSRSPDAELRLLSWNVGDRGPVTATEAFDRLMRALEPDVILLDEVARDIDAEWFERLFASFGGNWTVVRGESGGRQTALIASRLPLEPVASLASVEYPDSIYRLSESSSRQLQLDLATGPADRMPVLGAMLETGSSRLLLVTLDLPCCGYAGSAEDQARIVMADAINRAVSETVAAADPTGVIVAGDFNLVGSRTPLDRLLTGLDPADGDLAPVRALRSNGASAATWWNPSDRFPPGRLDWVLHSQTLEPVRAFVFDASDVTAAAAQSLGIEAADSDAVSDHRPVIVDFAVRR